ncbi:MAG: SMC-Scp complex subunit ScpB [Candidatus Omnitrophota bacterium]|jgi:segregation and condensation protein B
MIEENAQEAEQPTAAAAPEETKTSTLEYAAHAHDNTKSAIEAMLFLNDKTLLIEQIKKVFTHLTADEIRSVLNALKSEYESTNRGIRLYEVAGGFQMIAAPEFITFLRKLYKDPHSDKLSKPALETLAIIAYKQPLTKLEIETLRKVNVDGVMKTLLEKSLIRIIGRKKAPGNPKVYGTTRMFLEYFGLNTLEELPKIEKGDLAASLTKGEPENETREPAQTN